MTGAPLDPRKQLFVDEYLRNGAHGTEAAIAAGYKERSAATQASRLLNSPDIIAAVEAGKRRISRALGIDALDIVKEMRGIAYFNPAEVLKGGGDKALTLKSNLEDFPPEVARNFKTVKQGKYGLEITFYDRAAALRDLREWVPQTLPGVGAKPIQTLEDARDEVNRIHGMAASGEVAAPVAAAAIARVEAVARLIGAIEGNDLAERVAQLEALLRGEAGDDLAAVDIDDTSGNAKDDDEGGE